VEGKDLRRAGLKVTLPRLKILEILEQSNTRTCRPRKSTRNCSISSEDIGLATVYRVLTQFESAGLVSRHHFENGMAVFEINHGTHHDHIVCMDCGAVEEFVDADIESRQNSIATRLGFRIQEHSMVLYGRCQRTDCPAKRQGRVKVLV